MADETCELIRSTVRLFRERGDGATTMRVVAQEAGVAVGNAHHHVASTYELAQEVNRAHAAGAHADLAHGGDLASRRRTTWHAGLDGFSPSRWFGVESIGAAIRPRSPVSPFSPSSGSPDVRRTGTLVDRAAPLVGRLVPLSRLRVAPRTAQDLPRLLAAVRA